MLNHFYHIATITEIQKAILLGLKRYGRNRTFSQILTEANLFADGRERVETAFALEASGYIQSVTYQLPVAIRAELSSTGEKVVEAITDETRCSGRNQSDRSVN